MSDIVIASRGSRLSMAQVDIVDTALKKCGVRSQRLVISTKGDINTSSALKEIGGNGLFVREIEEALSDGRADIAVHSAKDLPYQLADGMTIGAVVKAASPADLLVIKPGHEDSLHVIGTGSARRKAAVMRLYPDAVVKNIRGNVETRLKKLSSEDYDAIVLARAGVDRLGIDLSGSLRVPGESTSTYLYIAGPDGDMALAVSDMEIYRHLTPEALRARLPRLEAARVVALDTNIPAESIEWLCANVSAPIFADPVSVAKSEKLRPVLGKLHTLKPNRLEAELLSGVAVMDEKSLYRAADALLQTGLQRVFITLGADGLLAAEGDERLRLPAPKVACANATGSGDAFLAALLWAHLEDADLLFSARAGAAAAAIAMAGPETVNPRMSAAALREKMTELETEEHTK